MVLSTAAGFGIAAGVFIVLVTIMGLIVIYIFLRNRARGSGSLTAVTEEKNKPSLSPKSIKRLSDASAYYISPKEFMAKDHLAPRLLTGQDAKTRLSEPIQTGPPLEDIVTRRPSSDGSRRDFVIMEGTKPRRYSGRYLNNIITNSGHSEDLPAWCMD